MLVLSRKIGEQIRIGEDIVLTILEVKGRQVRVGIDAPQEVPIWRAEIAFFNDAPAKPDHLGAGQPVVVASR